MKYNKLPVLLLLVLICLLSIAASFNQCGISTKSGHALSEDAQVTTVDLIGSSSNTYPESGSSTESSSKDSIAGYGGTDNHSSSTTGSGGGISTENATSDDTNSGEYDGQNSQASHKFAIIISGASYNRQQYGWFLSSTGMAYKLLRSSGYAGENIYYLFGDKNEPDVDYLSTMSNFKKAVQGIKSRSGIADTILVILIGHGGFDGANSYYCLSDRNLYDAEMADMFKDIIRDKLIFVFSPCNSGGFIYNLSGNNTVIITSTGKDEANRAAFIEPFLAAFDGSGDSDLDSKVSFAEAFNFASASVKQQYIDNSWGVLAEHAQLDDNGDKISTEALAPGGKDGELAGQIFLE